MSGVSYNRRSTREKVLQTLYAYELSKEPITDVIENILGDLQKDSVSFPFAKRLIQAVVQHQDEIEQFIKAKVSHWEFDRIAVIDRVLLRIAICEFLYFPDIPPKVTINESIEVAKIFSTEKSGRFINGVLDAVLEDLRSSKSLHKEGRGLMETSRAPGKKFKPKPGFKKK